MELYKCGSNVKLVGANVFGIITGISIRWENVLYEISYFLNNSHYLDWFSPCEIDFENSDDKINVGFHEK